MSLKDLLYITIIVSVLLPLMTSCSETTGTEKGALKGYVVLEDSEVIDYSGITVSLYNTVKMDTTIVRLNRDYPNIGVQISQKTEFDHRLYFPVKTVVTKADGSFEMRNVHAGQYNFVAHKEGWGFLYKHDVSITGGTFDVSDLVKPLRLYPEIIIDSHIFDELVCQPNRHYIFPENTIFHPSSNLLIKSDAVLRISSGNTITINGTLTTDIEPGSYFKVTSNDGYDRLDGTVENYGSFVVNPSAIVTDKTVRRGLYSMGSTALSVFRNNLYVRESIFTSGNTALYMHQVTGVTLKNNVFRNYQSIGMGAIDASHIDNCSIEDSIFIDNRDGILVVLTTDLLISNSYFYGNSYRAFGNTYNSEATVRNCVFVNSSIGIYNMYRSIVLVSKSVFSVEEGIRDRHRGLASTGPTMNYNNFHCSIFAVRTTAGYSGDYIRYLDATHNYWGTTNPTEIEQLIWDRNDATEGDHGSLAVIEYIPFLTHPVLDAGIQLIVK